MNAMSGLDAVAMLHRNFFHLPGLGAKPDQRLLYLVGVSTLLHGIFLALPVAYGIRAASKLKSLPIQATIRVQAIQNPAHGRSGSAQTEHLFAKPSPSVADPAPTTSLRPVQRPLMNRTTALPESDTSRNTSLNLENLLEQARTLAKDPSDQLVPSANRNQPTSVTAVPDLMDRPILQAISKHLGQPLRVMSEQIMNDGSRFIRFSGNTCLHIPRNLPFGRESEFTQTMLLPTNCP